MQTKIKVFWNTLLCVLTLLLSACMNTDTKNINTSILIVLAHPDDETWMNGTITRYLQANFDLHIIYAASGNRGSDNTGQNLQGEALAKYRQEEVRNALLKLGMGLQMQKSNVDFLAFDDGSLAQNSQQLSQIILQKIKLLDPSKVFSFGPGGITGHSDHIAISQATRIAYQQATTSSQLFYISIGRQRALLLEKSLTDFAVKKYMAKEISDSDNIIKIDVSQFQQQRISSTETHKSQFSKAILDAWKVFVINAPYEEFVVVP